MFGCKLIVLYSEGAHLVSFEKKKRESSREGFPPSPFHTKGTGGQEKMTKGTYEASINFTI